MQATVKEVKIWVADLREKNKGKKIGTKLISIGQNKSKEKPIGRTRCSKGILF